MSNPEGFEECAFFLAPSGGEDLGSGQACHLHRRQTNAAGGGVDQDLLAGLRVLPMRCSEYHAVMNAAGKVTASSMVRNPGLWVDQPGVPDDIGAKALRTDRHDLVARAKAGDA